MRILEVVSLNMGLANNDPIARYERLGTTLLDLPGARDVLAFQEVDTEVGVPQLEEICGALSDQFSGDYQLYLAPVYPAKEHEKVAAVITRLQVNHSAAHGRDRLGKRTQILELKDEQERSLVLANGHQESSPLREPRRMIKNSLFGHDLPAGYKDLPQIYACDLNSLPLFPSVLVLKKFLGFESAYEQVHGREPHHTYPTNLSEQAIRSYSTDRQFQALRLLASTLRFTRIIPEDRVSEDSGLIRYTPDYVFARNGPRAVEATLLHAATRGAEAPSDHTGLIVKYELSERRNSASVI